MSRFRNFMAFCVTLAALALLGSTWHAGAQERAIEWADGSVTVDGATIHYKVGGNGPPLLMIHGFVWGADYWDLYADAFGEHYTLIVPDLRGHGRSTGSRPVWSYQQSAQDMFAVLDGLGFEQVSGLGYSAGANTLIHMADQQPDRLSSMVLVAGAHRLTDEARDLARGYPPFQEAFTPEQQDELRRFHPGGDQQVESLFAQLRGLADNYEDFDFSPDELATIPVPTLLVWGDRDEFFPLDIALELYEALPNASFWVLPGESHLFLTSDTFGGSPLARERLAPMVLRFLKDPGSK